ncbi:MAG TPA: hypothetical protein VFV01_47860 [Spirillospora sp.]|nr:hypothetical protein [Spirillospora sp.]
MSAITDEPAVLTWQIALAPRPRFSTGGRHWWRELVTDAFRSATQAWWLDREAVALGYPTEMAEYEAAHPRPRLKDFMVHLSRGQVAPESHEEGEAA